MDGIDGQEQEKVVTVMEGYDWALMGTGRRLGAISPALSLLSLIIHLFQLVFSIETVFFSRNKSAVTVFRLIFSAKRMGH